MSASGMRVSRWGGIVTVIVALWLSGLLGAKAMAADGLTTVKSNYSPKETTARLEAAVTAQGMTVFAHIDHAAGAAKVHMKLRPTDLLIFRSPKGGTPVMQSIQTIAIDLPLKALVWQDQRGPTWLSYNDPVWLVGLLRGWPEGHAGRYCRGGSPQPRRAGSTPTSSAA